MTFRFLPHTADVIVEIEAASLADVFREAMKVVRRLVAGKARVAGTRSFVISLAAVASDELLLLFVRELLTRFQLDTIVPAKLDIRQLDGNRLEATVHGEPFADSRHEPQPEVKAVTRHGLSVAETATGWRAVLVLDL